MPRSTVDAGRRHTQGPATAETCFATSLKGVQNDEDQEVGRSPRAGDRRCRGAGVRSEVHVSDDAGRIQRNAVDAQFTGDRKLRGERQQG